MATTLFRSFHDLVHEIEQEYEEELARLRQENLWMRHRLGFAQDEQLNQEKVLGKLSISGTREALPEQKPDEIPQGMDESLATLSGDDGTATGSVEAVLAPVVINGGIVEAKEFKFETKSLWQKSAAKFSAWEGNLSAEFTQDLDKVALPACSVELGGQVKRTGRFMRKFQLPMSPNAPVRLSWDVASMVLISYDVWWIPLQCFNPEEDFFTTMMGWVSLVFWTLDMAATLMVGYFDNGELILDPKRIACRYLRTWFLPDLIVVLPDWFTRVVD